MSQDEETEKEIKKLDAALNIVHTAQKNLTEMFGGIEKIIGNSKKTLLSLEEEKQNLELIKQEQESQISGLTDQQKQLLKEYAAVKEELEKFTRMAVGEEHYNLISALHKSVRSSDVDAALYWLARMLESGEDRLYLARRLIRMSIEDIGLADPRALEQAIAAMQAVHFLGIPEGDLALAQVAIYLCAAPKATLRTARWARPRGRGEHVPIRSR